MKIYIAGKITGVENYKERFNNKAEQLRKMGYIVMNPSVLPQGFKHHEYLHINKAMIDVCDIIYFMDCWVESPGAKIELEYSILKSKIVHFESSEGVFR